MFNHLFASQPRPWGCRRDSILLNELTAADIELERLRTYEPLLMARCLRAYERHKELDNDTLREKIATVCEAFTFEMGGGAPKSWWIMVGTTTLSPMPFRQWHRHYLSQSGIGLCWVTSDHRTVGFIDDVTMEPVFAQERRRRDAKFITQPEDPHYPRSSDDKRLMVTQ